jgi:teichoic acid transport system permease protein
MREVARFWTNRHLLTSLVRQELRRTYAGTAGGILWALFTPLVPLLAFVTVFALGLRLPLGGAPYVLGFAAAYVPWVLVSSSVTDAAGSVVGHRYLVKRVRFPIEIVPASSIIVRSIPHALLLTLTIVAAAATGSARLPQLLTLPYFYVCGALFALGFGWLVAALTIVARDAQQALTAFINVWFWLTPVAWSATALPPRGQTLLALNPAAYVVAGYRYALMPEHFAAPRVSDSLVFWLVTSALLLVGATLFRRLRPYFWEWL